MRFRPLRIDYRSEAIQVLLRGDEEESRAPSFGDNDSVTRKWKRRQNVIEIFHNDNHHNHWLQDSDIAQGDSSSGVMEEMREKNGFLTLTDDASERSYDHLSDKKEPKTLFEKSTGVEADESKSLRKKSTRTKFFATSLQKDGSSTNHNRVTYKGAYSIHFLILIYSQVNRKRITECSWEAINRAALENRCLQQMFRSIFYSPTNAYINVFLRKSEQYILRYACSIRMSRLDQVECRYSQSRVLSLAWKRTCDLPYPTLRFVNSILEGGSFTSSDFTLVQGNRIIQQSDNRNNPSRPFKDSWPSTLLAVVMRQNERKPPFTSVTETTLTDGGDGERIRVRPSINREIEGQLPTHSESEENAFSNGRRDKLFEEVVNSPFKRDPSASVCHLSSENSHENELELGHQVHHDVASDSVEVDKTDLQRTVVDADIRKKINLFVQKDKISTQNPSESNQTQKKQRQMKLLQRFGLQPSKTAIVTSPATPRTREIHDRNHDETCIRSGDSRRTYHQKVEESPAQYACLAYPDTENEFSSNFEEEKASLSSSTRYVAPNTFVEEHGERKRKRNTRDILKNEEQICKKQREDEAEMCTQLVEVTSDAMKTPDKNPNRGLECIDTSEELETPKPLDQILGKRKTSPNIPLGDAKLTDVNNRKALINRSIRVSETHEAKSQDSKHADNTDQLEARKDPFYVSSEEIYEAEISEFSGRRPLIDHDPDLPKSDHDTRACRQVHPLRLLCSEHFLENFGESVTDFARGVQIGRIEEQTRRVHFVDTYLMDESGVDIEMPSREAILVASLSKIVASIDSDSIQKNFLPRIVELAATTRYRRLIVVLRIDCQLHPSIYHQIVRLQGAFVCNGFSQPQPTKTSLQLVSLDSFSESLAKLIFGRIRVIECDAGESHSTMPDLPFKWLSDTRACQRLKFLMTIVPTLTVTGALLWLDLSGTPMLAFSEKEVPLDKSLAWFYRCFQSPRDECKRLSSMILSSNALSDSLHSSVPCQFATAMEARLNGKKYQRFR